MIGFEIGGIHWLGIGHERSRKAGEKKNRKDRFVIRVHPCAITVKYTELSTLCSMHERRDLRNKSTGDY
jgi:hypothetical protein